MATATRAEAGSSRRRQAILEAGIARFATRGFTATTTTEIADLAGVGHGTVFLHFTSKEALFQAALLEPLAEIEPLFAVPPSEAGAVLPQLRTIVREHCAHVATHESYLLLVHYVLGQHKRFPTLARRLREFARRSTAGLSALVARGQRNGELGPGRPELVALSYFAFLQGLAITLRAPATDPIWTAMADRALRLFAPIEINGRMGT